jgi:thiamine biosynthesis protein ThiS
MITVNGKPTDLGGGLTVTELLERMGFVWPMLVVRINGRLVKRDRFADTTVADGDAVDVIHMMSGG